MGVRAARGGTGVGRRHREVRSRRSRTRSAIVVIGAVTCLLTVGACAGSDDGSDRPLPTLPDGGAARPEGVWSFVSVEIKRSDQKDLDAGKAGVRRYELRPTCRTGPCDITVRAAGEDGTAYPEGVTPPDGTEASTEPVPPFRWDPDEEAYVRRATDPSSCTNADGKTIDDAYRVTTTTTMTFTPPRGGRPAGLHGTYRRVAEETDAGKGKGCTSFTTSGDVFAMPVGALRGSEWPDLTGRYVATETVERIEPLDEERPPGLVGLLGEQQIRRDDGYRITGLLEATADLVTTRGGLAGRATKDQACAADKSGKADGFTSTETWTEMLPLALTADGQAVLGSRWHVYQNPTAAGAKAGCSLATNTGYVVLVPKEVVG